MLSQTVNCQLSTVNCRRRQGFTFIELLVVVSIIAILLTAIVATFGGAQAKGRDSRRKQDLDALKKALELFKSDSRAGAFYPECATPDAIGWCDITSFSDFDPILGTAYIRQVPTDPTPTTNGNYRYHGIKASGPGACNVVNTVKECDDYAIIACLENDNEPLGNGVQDVGALNAGDPGSWCPGTRFISIIAP